MAERLCGMANAQGGMIILGVKDAVHEIVGIPDHRIGETLDVILEAVRQMIKPGLVLDSPDRKFIRWRQGARCGYDEGKSGASLSGLRDGFLQARLPFRHALRKACHDLLCPPQFCHLIGHPIRHLSVILSERSLICVMKMTCPLSSFMTVNSAISEALSDISSDILYEEPAACAKIGLL
jgi:Putative DNA-binding domain